jgi:hypothetical protein
MKYSHKIKKMLGPNEYIEYQNIMCAPENIMYTPYKYNMCNK